MPVWLFHGVACGLIVWAVTSWLKSQGKPQASLRSSHNGVDFTIQENDGVYCWSAETVDWRASGCAATPGEAAEGARVAIDVYLNT